eukprot:TRINITY_DN14955_c1_g2_i1.p1 TRINITY_DN14955_c1_g2~~TRINITY_DN14955_c1_g2_i1.p1  ORF type:complete len:112 (+),score=7.26 TRINITY_DN14955_c1_g2_i1:4031-4366(+)
MTVITPTKGDSLAVNFPEIVFTRLYNEEASTGSALNSLHSYCHVFQVLLGFLILSLSNYSTIAQEKVPIKDERNKVQMLCDLQSTKSTARHHYSPTRGPEKHLVITALVSN